MANMVNPTKVVTGKKTRWSYANVWEPKATQDGKLKYSVCTDAPYFVDLNSTSGKIKNDNLNDKEAYEFLMKVFKNLHDYMQRDASFYEFYATAKARIFHDAFEDNVQ